MNWQKTGIFSIKNGAPHGAISHVAGNKALFAKRRLFFTGYCVLFALCFLTSVLYSQNQTEFGAQGDFTVFGIGGNWNDADVEMKGFSIFGSSLGITQNIESAPGNIFVGGGVQLSSGMYVTGGSTFATGAYFTGISSFSAGPSSIYINGGKAGQVITKLATGAMQWSDVATLVSGDNLGSHIATATLNMSGFDLTNISTLTYRENVFISSAAAEQGGGVYISSNTYIMGFSSATKYYGDGSGLTGVTGATDNTKVLKAGDTMTGRLTAPDYTATYGITAASAAFTQVSLADNVLVSSEAAAALGAGVRISSNVY
ncbi:MAG TPA: hypothetical protein DCL44_03330, partial [Elusimicrobia bacterium]|nr:hypothetical protein [Elusimicrobiota bacterium]